LADSEGGVCGTNKGTANHENLLVKSALYVLGRECQSMLGIR